MAEQRDVRVRHVIVANAAIAAVADVIFRQQVLFIEVPFSAVRRRVLAGAPEFWEIELVVGIDERRDRLVEGFLGDVALIHPRDLASLRSLERAVWLGPRLQP